VTAKSMISTLQVLGFAFCMVIALLALSGLGDTLHVRYYSKPIEPQDVEEAVEEAVEEVEEVTAKIIEKAMLDLAATLREIDIARAAGQDTKELQAKAVELAEWIQANVPDFDGDLINYVLLWE